MSKYDYTRLGRDLFTKRGKLGENKSRYQLAKQIGISTTTIKQIEDGEPNNYGHLTMDAVTKYLGVELNDYKLDDYVDN